MDNIEFQIADVAFEAVKSAIGKGRVHWRFPADSASSGYETEPLSETLPDSLQCLGQQLNFGPVTKKNRGSEQSEKKQKDVTKAREVNELITIEETIFQLRCRVTRRRNKKWWIWLHIDPVPRPVAKNSNGKHSSHIEPTSSSSLDTAEKKIVRALRRD